MTTQSSDFRRAVTTLRLFYFETMRKKNIYLLLLLTFISCKNEKKTHKNLLDSNVTISKIGEKNFLLDSITSSNSLSLYFESRGKKYFTLLNKKINAIYFYDYETEILEKVVKYPVDGPGSVGLIEGYYFKNEDSVLIHGRGGIKLFISDMGGSIYKEYDLSNSKGYVNPSSLSNAMPIMLKGNNIYMNAWGHQREYYENRNYPESLILNLNLETGINERYGSYPESYINNGVWGIQFHVMWNTMNEESGDLILSFPNSDSLMIINDLGITQMVNTESNKIGQVKPLSAKNRFVPKDQMFEFKNYETQNTYGGVYYDKYNKYVYRYVNLAMSENDFDSQHPIRSRNQKKNLIILDSSYNRIGEVVLDSSYIYSSIPTFINELGFHINTQKYTSEDTLKFDILKFDINE